MNFFKKLFNHEYKELEKFKNQANLVMEKEEEMTKLSDEERSLYRRLYELQNNKKVQQSSIMDKVKGVFQ